MAVVPYITRAVLIPFRSGPPSMLSHWVREIRAKIVWNQLNSRNPLGKYSTAIARPQRESTRPAFDDIQSIDEKIAQAAAVLVPQKSKDCSE
uniref:ATP synthase subunit epsilon, mitochondrial n=1 Tax=Angiostrongylus cantonensis TaxID=6313 RepID=A0A0K0CTL5_ANGCA